MTYREALDEALRFGWIDGLRKRYSTGSYTVRFSPRIEGSIWSVVNARRMEELVNLGRVDEAGLKSFQQRDRKKSKLYSYVVGNCQLDPTFEKQFRASPAAWEFYQVQAPWYRRTSCYWVMSAKKEETRLRRLVTLIQDSAAGRRIKLLTANPKEPDLGFSGRFWSTYEEVVQANRLRNLLACRGRFGPAALVGGQSQRLVPAATLAGGRKLHPG